MNSKIIAWASFFTLKIKAKLKHQHNQHIWNKNEYLTYLGGILPSTFLNLYLLERISSINISYGVISYSMGVQDEKSTFLSLTPILNSPITCIQNRAYNQEKCMISKNTYYNRWKPNDTYWYLMQLKHALTGYKCYILAGPAISYGGTKINYNSFRITIAIQEHGYIYT